MLFRSWWRTGAKNGRNRALQGGAEGPFLLAPGSTAELPAWMRRGYSVPEQGEIEKRAAPCAAALQTEMPTRCAYSIPGIAASGSLPRKSWSVMAATEESDHTFTPVSIMSMMA